MQNQIQMLFGTEIMQKTTIENVLNFSIAVLVTLAFIHYFATILDHKNDVHHHHNDDAVGNLLPNEYLDFVNSLWRTGKNFGV